MLHAYEGRCPLWRTVGQGVNRRSFCGSSSAHAAVSDDPQFVSHFYDESDVSNNEVSQVILAGLQDRDRC